MQTLHCCNCELTYTVQIFHPLWLIYVVEYNTDFTFHPTQIYISFLYKSRTALLFYKSQNQIKQGGWCRESAVCGGGYIIFGASKFRRYILGFYYMSGIIWDQWLSIFPVYQNHLEVFLIHRSVGPTCRILTQEAWEEHKKLHKTLQNGVLLQIHSLLHVQYYAFGRLKLAMVGVVTPQISTNTTNQSFSLFFPPSFFHEPVFKHLPAYH